MFKKFLIVAMLQSVFLFTYASAKQIQYEGYTSYNRYGSQITLSADRVKSYRGRGKTGTLKMMLWASKHKYRGGNIRGYVVGESKLGRLIGNNYYSNLRRTVSFKTPPRGRYYMTLTLSEYRNGRYQIVDYVSYQRKERF